MKKDCKTEVRPNKLCTSHNPQPTVQNVHKAKKLCRNPWISDAI